MDIEQRMPQFNVSVNIFRFLLLFILIGVNSYSNASDWKITPSLTFTETYSDNVNLAPSGKEESAFVTELSPGVSVRRQTARHSLNFDYRMQNLQNSGGRDKIETFNQLQTDSNLEILRESLFLDMSGSISQQNTQNSSGAIGGQSTGANANNNSSGSSNRSNIKTFDISPYWTPHLNGYADGEVRFTYNNVKTDNGITSNTEDYNYLVNLVSGKRFTNVTWFLDYKRNEQIRDTGNNVEFQNALGELRAHINRYFNVFTQLGYIENSFQGASTQNNNGIIYSIGAQWIPSKRLNIEIAIGNNSFATLDIEPVRNMHWITTYRDDEVGTNPNSVWETSLDYRTKRSVWTVRYKEDTTTVQNLLSTNNVFSLTNQFGNVVTNPVTQQAVQSNLTLPTLVDDVILKKDADISFTYQTGKSDIAISVFSNIITSQVNKSVNEVIGINGVWDWKFTHRTTFSFRPRWQQTTAEARGASDRTDTRSDITLGLNRAIPFNLGRRGTLNAGLAYRYVNQKSDIKSNEFIENSITASLFFTY